MRRAILIVISFSVISFYSTRNVQAIDGYLWTNLPPLCKTAFVLGWVEASNEAVESMPLFIVGVLRKDKEGEKPFEDWEQTEKYKKISERWAKRCGADLSEFGIDQVVKTINKIYEDQRVKKWGIQDIMELVGGRLREGWTEKDLDEVIGYKIKLRDVYKRMQENMSKKEGEKVNLYHEWKSLDDLPNALKALNKKYN